VLAGFFPTTVTFRGSFRYGSVEDLDAGLAEIQQLIDGEDEDLVPDLELRRRGCELRVRVDTTCARDSYLAYETLIEALASRACDGEVVGEIDDTITQYAAPAKPLAKVAAIIAWLPLVTCESLLVGLA
jgi:hypothetical protein